jgi:hypothetical protein
VKKILITGMTSRHCGSDRVRVKYAQATAALAEMLKMIPNDDGDALFEVENRPVAVDEDLSKFDHIFVGLHDLNSIATNTKHLLGVAWACLNFTEKVILHYDDWSGMEVNVAASTLVRTWAKRLPYLRSRAEVSDHAAAVLFEFASMLAEKHVWPASVIPAFDWADPAKLITAFPKTRRAMCWDPTSFTDIAQDTIFDKDGPRERRWVLACLQNPASWLKKLNNTWPVLGVGLKSQGQPLLTELDVRALYHQNWGVLAPKYEAPGWWRARFYHAAEAKAVLFADRTDSTMMADCFRLPRHVIEIADDATLRKIAEDQSAWTLNHVAPRQRVVDQFKQFLHE